MGCPFSFEIEKPSSAHTRYGPNCLTDGISLFSLPLPSANSFCLSEVSASISIVLLGPRGPSKAGPKPKTKKAPATNRITTNEIHRQGHSTKSSRLPFLLLKIWTRCRIDESRNGYRNYTNQPPEKSNPVHSNHCLMHA